MKDLKFGMEKELCSLASKYYDEFGRFEMDILTDEHNECHISINAEWLDGQK
jgi:hypothetical protein